MSAFVNLLLANDLAGAYLAASGQTADATVSAATRQLASSLQQAAFWSKLRAFWPMAGTTATHHRFNLLNPSVYALSYTGTIAFAATGMTGDGSTAFANTGFNPLAAGMTRAKGVTIGYYNRSANTGQADSVDMGAISSSTSKLLVSANNASNGNKPLARNLNNALVGSTATTRLGFFQSTSADSTGSGHSLYQGSSLLASGEGSGDIPNDVLYLLALNFPGSGNANNAYGNSNRECAGAYVADALTASELLAMAAIMQTFQTALGRNV